MNGITQFLQRYLNFTPPALVRSRAISKALFEKFGVECKEDWVAVRGDTAFVRVDGMLKSEIALHKTELLARIAELGGGTLADLR
jgi:hypothetical protein